MTTSPIGRYDFADPEQLVDCFAAHHARVMQLLSAGYDAPAPSLREVRNILVCTDHANWRTGHYAAVAGLAAQLNEHGYRAVLALKKKPPAAFRPAGVEIAVCPFAGLDAESFRVRLDSLSKIVREHDIDTVILNSWKGSYKYWDLLILQNLFPNAPEKNPRVLLHFHSSFARPQFEVRSNWLRDNTRLVRLFDGLLVNNQMDAEFWRCYNPRVYCYPLAIDHVPAPDEPSRCDPRTVVYIARFSETKNQLAALEAFRHVVEKVPDAKLVLAGNDNKGYRARCEERVESLGLSDNVEIRDFVSGQEKDELLRSAYCAINTSLFEGFSQYLCEVKAYGLPLVTFNLPNLTMLDGGEENGAVIVPSGNKEALGEQIVRLLADSDERDRLGRAARAHYDIVANFDYEQFWTSVFDDMTRPKPSVDDCEMQRRIYDSLFDAIYRSNIRASAELGKLKAQMKHPKSVRGYARRVYRKVRSAIGSIGTSVLGNGEASSGDKR